MDISVRCTSKILGWAKILQTFRGAAAFLICRYTDLKKENYGKQPAINHFCTLQIISFQTLLSYPGCCWICKILRTWYKSEPLIFHGFIAARKILALRFQFAKDEAARFCDFFSLAQDSVAQNSIAQGFSPGI
jgi:hypothetical protein